MEPLYAYLVTFFVDQLNIGKFAGLAQLTAFVIKLRFHGYEIFFQHPAHADGSKKQGPQLKAGEVLLRGATTHAHEAAPDDSEAIVVEVKK